MVNFGLALLACIGCVSSIAALSTSSPLSSRTCPASTPGPTQTRTRTTTSITRTVTKTSTVTSAAATRTSYTSTVSIYQTVYNYSTVGTQTVTAPTYVQTVVTTLSGPSTPVTTKFVPSTCGFTPIRSDPVCTAKKTIVTKLASTSTTIFKRSVIPVTVLKTDQYRSVDKTTTLPDNYVTTVYTTPQSTVTRTETPSVTTVYEACGTNNIVKNLPDGSSLSSYGLVGTDSLFLFAGARDEVACCGYCQSTPYCAGSIFVSGSADSTSNCAFVIVNSTAPVEEVCRSNSIAYGSAGSSGYPGVFLIASNGPCGRIALVDYFTD